MTLKEYLRNDDQEELTKRLIKLDASIMSLHQNGFYVVSFDANEIELYNEELTLDSFKNKIDYLNSGINLNGDKRDILEICAIGICAYNGFTSFYINKEFLNYLMEHMDVFKDNGRIPNEMYEYYHSVLVEGNIEYLNTYLYNKLNSDANSNKVTSNSYKIAKSTAIGRAFKDKENAYVSILLIPAIIVFVYCVILVTIMIIK